MGWILKKKPGPVQRVLDRLLSPQLDARGGLLGFGLKVLRCLYLSYREFRLDICFERAASLTFTTIISLLPLAVLFLSIWSLFMDQARFQDFVESKFLSYFTTEDLQTQVREWIRENINKGILQVGTGVNVVAIAALVVAALALLVSAERNFNRIWKVRGTRNYLKKFVAFWMIFTTSPFLVAVSIYVDNTLASHALVKDHATLQALYGFLVPVVVSCTAFTSMNLFLPYIRVRLLPALMGGCLSGLLWEGLKKLFFLYFERAISFQSFYGSLAILPIFLIFIYATWVIILWGAEFSYAGQNYGMLMRLVRQQREPASFSPPFLGMYYLERVLRPFYRGERLPSLENIAEDLDLHPEELLPIVQKLVDLGVLIEVTEEGGRFVPYRAPSTVSLREIVDQLLLLEAKEETLSSDEGAGGPVKRDDVQGISPGVRLLQNGRQAFRESFDGRTLEDLGRGGSSVVSSMREGPSP